MDLSREEFLTHVGLLRNDIAGVHDRLDAINGRTRINELDIAVMKDRQAQTKDPTARWSALGAGAAAVGGAIWNFLK